MLELARERPTPSLKMVLDRTVGATGSVQTSSGGFEIRIADADRFPWAAVFKTLLDAAQEIYVDRKAGTLVILSKHTID